MESREEKLKNIVSSLPDSPGVYQYFDDTDTIIYVGKAKNLKRRVASYFNKNHDSPKTRILVSKIQDIHYIVVGSEEDALHLENSLIKKLQPRYNVMLKDDKTYPWICITNEPFPRIFQTRNVIRNGSQYFGPYSNVYLVRTMLEFIRKIYPIRTCKLLLLPENIRQHKFKVCLEFHIKNCKGGCEGLETESEYAVHIAAAKRILKGEIEVIKDDLTHQMQDAAGRLEFEEAHRIKEKLQLVDTYQSKSVIVSPMIQDTDIFSCIEEDNMLFVNYLHVTNGSINQAYTFEMKKKLDEPKEELLGLAIVEMRERFKSFAKEIILPFCPDVEFQNILFTIPQRGDKKKLLELSEQNVRQYKADRMKQAEKLNPEQRTVRILSTLQKDLRLHNMPFHIECFDNSNIQGTSPVAACVVFKKAKPAKKDYRHFNVKTVEGPDDFASMREIVYRRYSRMLEENTPLPDLIVIDGGKGQLHAACESLHELKIYGKIPIIGIAKRLEEIYYPDDSVPLYLDKNSESLKLIQQLRDEAHRFGITFHRLKRSKKQVVSELDSVEGIGEKTKTTLLSHFKSLKRIKAASMEELTELIGKSRAEKLFTQIHK
ncbi:MAG: excinuclease ABC subunit UvrC [Bacteroidales bacterium]